MRQINEIMQDANFGKNKENAIKKLFEFSEFEKQIKNIYISFGKLLVGEGFLVKKEFSKIITNLLIYFTGNTGEYDLNKGIYLVGDYGVGKSTIFTILRKLLAHISLTDNFGKKLNPNGFQITSVEQIIDVYKKDGSLDYFGFRKESKPLHLCINEFGKDVNEKIYGTQANELINSLFMIRYELFQQGYLTHCTSNFHPKDLKIEKIIADRMKEMFNFIELKGESFRK